MLVYVISKQKQISFTLPSKIYGNYWIQDIDENNNEKNIINISENNGQWVAYSNKTVKIMINDEIVRSAVLEDYQFLFLKVKDEPGYLILYTCPVNDSTMKRLTVNKDMQITIGSDPKNTIHCQNRLLAPTHIKLTYQKTSWIIEPLKSEYGIFVNNKIVTGITRLNHGDVIFAMGLKLIILENSILINNPQNSVTYDKKALSPYVDKEYEEITPSQEEEEEIELYEENDYFVRSPRFMESIEPEVVQIEDHPKIDDSNQSPWYLTIGPMITMGSTSFVMLLVSFMQLSQGNREFINILPTLVMSISMMAGTMVWPSLNRSFSKKELKKKKAKMQKKYGEYLIKKEEELKSISEKQKNILLANSMSSNECYNLIATRSKKLWERELHQKDFLTVRLGLGNVPLKIKLDYPGEHFSIEDEDQLEEKMRIIVNKYKEIENAPIVESLIEKNILALTGKYEYTKPYIDALLLQIIALHSHYDLKIVILTNKARKKDWEYMNLMPHVFSDNRDIRFIATNFEEGVEVSSYLQKILRLREKQCEKISANRELLYKNYETYYLIITDDYKLVKDYSIINELLEVEGNLGFSLLILHPNLANLPTQCKAFISLDDFQKGGIFENELSKDTQRNFTIEKIEQTDLDYCSLRLANIPIKNKSENYNIPTMINFLEMYHVGKIEQLNPLERWKVNNPVLSLGVPIGVDMNGKDFKLDLHEKAQGPHGLIAGMTGSGKSEFIITYILSMAINFHPDEVQFVLIDYKGGGLVGAFENKETGVKLPHLAGTITNLETVEINRALASIESELKRRQELFNKARDQLGEGTIDIYKYQKYYREGLLDTPVSHLFIISDEFAELKSQQPDFMDQLISTARIGRSLGVHLILATQKPSGIVNDQIWSNSRFRVCLKVQEAADSNEVIKRPDAADIKDVGRFYLQVGYNEMFSMGQAAWAGAPYIPQDKVYHKIDNSVVFINQIGKSIKTIDPPKQENLVVQGDQLPNIVKYLASFKEKEKIEVPKLWLEKLPEIIYLDALKEKYHFQKKSFELQAIIGEYDNPKAQQQGLFTLDLAKKGNVIIYSMMEKVTISNAIIYSLITNYTTKEVNIYIMDFDSETLKVYQQAPQVGDVIFASDHEKVEKLSNMLLTELETRKKLFQDYNGSYDFYIKHSKKQLPGIVLLITGYENFSEGYEEQEEIFQKIAREGHKYGIYMIITAISERALRLNMRSSFPIIVPLRLGSNSEYNMLLGKRCPEISDSDTRGIALIEDEPYEFQTASIYDNDKLNEYLKIVCKTLSTSLTEKAKAIPILPSVVTPKILQPAFVDFRHVPIGIEEQSLNIATYDFTNSLINLINSDDLEALNNFSRLLIQETKQQEEIETVVIDLKNNYSQDINEIYLTQKDDVINNMEQRIFDPTRNKQLFIFVNGSDRLINMFPPDKKMQLNEYFTKIQELNNCHFIFVDRLIDLKAYSFESWFHKFVETDCGIWIGKGIQNSSVHNLTTSFKILNMPIPANFGYMIQKGNAILIKLLEKDDHYE